MGSIRKNCQLSENCELSVSIEKFYCHSFQHRCPHMPGKLLVVSSKFAFFYGPAGWLTVPSRPPPALIQ